jgi:CheY-like chemotaxis protein
MAATCVLLVEDEKEGGIYRDLLVKTLGVAVVWAKNSAEVRSAIESCEIKVAVIDQVLEPGVTGTELWPTILKLQPMCRAVLLSNKCKPADVGRAMNIGFSEFVDKIEQIGRLPEVVASLIQQFEVDKVRAATDVSKRELVRFGPRARFIVGRVTVLLTADTVLERQYLFPDRWEEKAVVEAGQEYEREVVLTLSRRTEFEKTASQELESQLGIGAALVSKRLGAALSARHRQVIDELESASAEYTGKLTLHMKLPPIPDDVSTKYLASQSSQVNQVYEKHLCRLEIVCPYCANSETRYMAVFVPTASVARRQVVTFSDGEQQTIDLGITRQSRLPDAPPLSL